MAKLLTFHVARPLRPLALQVPSTVGEVDPQRLHLLCHVSGGGVVPPILLPREGRRQVDTVAELLVDRKDCTVVDRPAGAAEIGLAHGWVKSDVWLRKVGHEVVSAIRGTPRDDLHVGHLHVRPESCVNLGQERLALQWRCCHDDVVELVGVREGANLNFLAWHDLKDAFIEADVQREMLYEELPEPVVALLERHVFGHVQQLLLQLRAVGDLLKDLPLGRQDGLVLLEDLTCQQVAEQLHEEEVGPALQGVPSVLLQRRSCSKRIRVQGQVGAKALDVVAADPVLQRLVGLRHAALDDAVDSRAERDLLEDVDCEHHVAGQFQLAATLQERRQSHLSGRVCVPIEHAPRVLRGKAHLRYLFDDGLLKRCGARARGGVRRDPLGGKVVGPAFIRIVSAGLPAYFV
mmetsp:Transcript_82848/g.208686  ORF Transcript_82848/g.208686 Transcript_82848/m.208686 type:complete len:405 (-) Transcript_82848:442-1656(-)